MPEHWSLIEDETFFNDVWSDSFIKFTRTNYVKNAGIVQNLVSYGIYRFSNAFQVVCPTGTQRHLYHFEVILEMIFIM